MIFFLCNVMWGCGIFDEWFEEVVYYYWYFGGVSLING